MEKKNRRKSRSKSQNDLGEDEEDQKQKLNLLYGRREYEDGIYEGYFHNGLRHGKGSMKGKNGFLYFEGKWENDKPNGYGMMKFPHSGDRHEGNYRDGRRDGLGVFLWANGDKYSGHFKTGMMHGYGRFEWASGDVYNGDFKEGKAEGDGYKTYADGRKSYGMFEHSVEHGWVKQTWPDGNTYSGFVEDNQVHRFGCFDWMKGDRYEGEWKHEVFHGIGCYTTVQGGGPIKEITEIQGNFEDGELVGLGYYRSSNNDFEYYGEFKKNKEEIAWGHLEYDNGIHYDGDTLQLNRHGMVSAIVTNSDDILRETQGQLSYSNIPLSLLEELDPFDINKLKTAGDLLEYIQQFGARFIGTFFDDMPHGKGELFFSDGQLFTLVFSHGLVGR